MSLVSIPVMEKLERRLILGAPGGCWLWAGSHIHDGYAQFTNRDGRSTRAHRDHLCRVRGCLNPAHMEPVTAAENIRRRDASKAQIV